MIARDRASVHWVIGNFEPSSFSPVLLLSTKYQVLNTDLHLQSCVRNYSSCKEGPRRMDISYHDVLLLGGGGAGLRAAIAVSEVNPDLSVAVVSKVYPMRSHTVSAEGGAAGVIKPGDTLDDHAYDTISGGDWLCDEDAVELFVKEAPEELLRLEHWGCPWSREPDK